MRIFKIAGTKLLALALAFAVLPTAVPSNVPVVGVSQAEARDYRHDGPRRFYRHGGRFSGRNPYLGDRNYHGRDRYYHGRDRYYRGRHDRNGIAAGALLGLGIGTVIGAYPRYDDGPRYYRSNPGYHGRGYAYRSRDWYESCLARYRSFDPRTGTYQPNHGPRRVCR